MGAQIEIRIPVVPGYNDREVAAIESFLGTLKRMPVVKKLTYHNYAGSKYDALGMKNTLP